MSGSGCPRGRCPGEDVPRSPCYHSVAAVNHQTLPHAHSFFLVVTSARRYISVMSRVLLASLMSSKMPNDAGSFGEREFTCIKRYSVQMRNKTFEIHTRVAKRECSPTLS